MVGQALCYALVALLWATTASAQAPYTLTLQSNSPITVVSPSPSPTSTPTPTPTPTPITSTMTITAPPDRSTVGGTTTVSYLGTPDVAWANMYVDGGWKQSSGSGNSGSFTLDTTTLSNGKHTIAVTGFSSPSNTALASASISVTVTNTGPTPSPSSTPTPTVIPTNTPTPVPTSTPSPVAGAVYFSPSGNDSAGDGSQAHPYATVAKFETMIGAAQPGAKFLFLAGQTWNEAMIFGDVPAHAVHGTVANPIIVSIYGQTQQAPYAILDEQNVRPYGISSMYPQQLVNGLSISGFEIKHATSQCFAFRIPGNSVPIPSAQEFQGISFVGYYCHNNGPGASQTDGPIVGNDAQGGYKNQVVFEDDLEAAHSFYAARGIIRWSGGHNCGQIHGDTGSPTFDSNIVGPGCPHNMVDVKMVGNYANGNLARVTNNYLNCGFSQPQKLCGPNNSGSDALFAMNVVPSVNMNLLYQGNMVFDVGGTRSGFAGSCMNLHPNAVPSGCPSGQMCSVRAKAYNNACYGTRSSATIGVGYMPTAGAGGPSSFDMQNNIIDGFGTSVSVQGLSTATEGHNNVGGQQGSSGFNFNGSKTPSTNDVMNVDPKYVNANVGNLNLKAGSPMLNAGNNLNNGNPNIGAYAGSGQ